MKPDSSAIDEGKNQGQILNDPPAKNPQSSFSFEPYEQAEKAGQGDSPSIKNNKAEFLKFAQVLLALAVVISAAYLAYSSLHAIPLVGDKASKELKDAPPVVTVSLAEAKIRPVDEVLNVTGSISSWDELKVATEVGGLHVKAIYVDEGDRVRKGQLLAELNASLLEAQLEQATARLKSAEANLLKSVQPNRPEDIVALNAALAEAEAKVLQEEAHMAQAEVSLESAELNVPRYEGLAKLGAVSQVDAETKRFARETAKHELASAEQKVLAAKRQVEQAKQKVLLAGQGGRREDVQITKASLEEIRAQIRHLSAQIKQTKVLAHDDGLILQRLVHIGDTSDPGKAFYIMSRLNKLELKALVNDSDLSKFRAGQEVRISTSESAQASLLGKVKLVSPQVDPQTRLGTVRIEVPDDPSLKAGMFAKGEISLSQHKGLTVPLNCLVTRSGESFVFTLDGKKAVATPVEPGMQTSELVEIKKGLKEGEKVIDKGARFLSDGDTVEVSGSEL